MPISNYPKGFANGVAIQGLPLLNTYAGNIWWVDSGAGSNGNPGTHIRPFATIDYAVGRCTANNGDIIMVRPGHTETVTAAAGIAFDVAGVSVIGLGNGSDRPTIDFTTAVSADVDIDAANVTIQNILFTGGIDALTGPIDVNAADCKLLNIETRDVTGQTTDFIVTDANADRLLIDGWKHIGAAGDGGDSAISIVGGDDIEIRNFNLYGNFDQGAIENVTTAAVRANIHDGFIWTEGAEDLGIIMHASATGKIGPNIEVILQDNAANITQAVAGAAMYFFQPIRLVNNAGESSLETNITASTDA